MKYDEVISALPATEADSGPWFAFSIHKSGSTLFSRMVASVCKQCDIPAVSIPALVFAHGLSDSGWQNDPDILPAFQRKYLYHGFRFLPPVLKGPEMKLRRYPFALLVRDPRDALVSQYFSYGRKDGSHKLPPKNTEAFLARREEQEDKDIDTYVSDVARGLVNKLRAYHRVLDFDTGLVRRYEDVYFDKQTFLRDVFGHFAIPVPAEIIRSVAEKNDIRPDEEDQSKHIRKGAPGDHIQKLKPETIARLNDTFRDVAKPYGYDL